MKLKWPDRFFLLQYEYRSLHLQIVTLEKRRSNYSLFILNLWWIHWTSKYHLIFLDLPVCRTNYIQCEPINYMLFIYFHLSTETSKHRMNEFFKRNRFYISSNLVKYFLSVFFLFSKFIVISYHYCLASRRWCFSATDSWLNNSCRK